MGKTVPESATPSVWGPPRGLGWAPASGQQRALGRGPVQPKQHLTSLSPGTAPRALDGDRVTKLQRVYNQQWRVSKASHCWGIFFFFFLSQKNTHSTEVLKRSRKIVSVWGIKLITNPRKSQTKWNHRGNSFPWWQALGFFLHVEEWPQVVNSSPPEEQGASQPSHGSTPQTGLNTRT